MEPAPSYDKRTVRSWSLYDFANSAFTTLIVTFVYAVYFTDAIAPSHERGLTLWSWGVSSSAILVALMSPFLGAMADSGGHRRRYLLLSTVICVAGSVVLFFPLPGQIAFALITFVIANVAFEMANVFYNAYLPDIAPLSQIGKVSGNGWALGYIGGLFCLLVGYFVLVQPSDPPFGLSAEDGSNVRAVTLLVAGWFALFSLPMFLWVKDKKVENPPPAGVLFRFARQELAQTFREIRNYRNLVRLLVARFVYNDGLITIFALGGIYAVDTFGVNIFYFGIILNLAAGVGAFAMGYLDDYIGGRKTILISIVGLALATITAVLTTNVTVFWASAVLTGILAGPNQSASRSLFSRFVPENHENEFFGFFAFSGKFTAFIGPFLVGLLTHIYHSQRIGISVVVLMFIAGGLLLLRVDEKEGIATANRTGAAELLG